MRGREMRWRLWERRRKKKRREETKGEKVALVRSPWGLFITGKVVLGNCCGKEPGAVGQAPPSSKLKVNPIHGLQPQLLAGVSFFFAFLTAVTILDQRDYLSVIHHLYPTHDIVHATGSARLDVSKSHSINHSVLPAAALAPLLLHALAACQLASQFLGLSISLGSIPPLSCCFHSRYARCLVLLA